ncbi:MAG TPA: carboxymuconolactone decarboxylase family protein [Limnobacter sp.]|nr:carboxymuconolactone decarboxylase family protein [Limnobacter sp.]
MSTSTPQSAPQGFASDTQERLPLLPRERMNAAQQAAADSIIQGPRKAIFGPFVPLLHTPVLMERVGKLGEALRFEGSLPDKLRELAICVVSRETHNQFEWQTHAPLAAKAGVAQASLDALRVGARPTGMPADEAQVVDFVQELLLRHGVSDASYTHAVARLGEAGVVELCTLVGYFAMVCWVMNVARTPGPANSQATPLQGLPG